MLLDKVGMAGYRDMNLYGTLYDGLSLKQKTGVEIETFECWRFSSAMTR